MKKSGVMIKLTRRSSGRFVTGAKVVARKMDVQEKLKQLKEAMQRDVMDKFKRYRQEKFRNLKEGFLKCQILRAEPVDAVIGEVVVDQTDFHLPGRIPLVWQRHYGSQSSRRGLCGYGWESPGDARLEFRKNGSVIFYDGQGAPAYFDFPPREGPMLEAVDGGLLDKEEGYYTVTTKTGLVFRFPVLEELFGESLVESVTDPGGNNLRYLRDDNGLQEIQESSGRKIVVTGQNGLIEQLDLQLPQGESRLLVRYEYDHQDCLTAVYDPLNQPTTYGYQEKLLVRHTNRNGVSFYYEYDDYHPKGKCLHAFGEKGLYDYRFVYHEDDEITEVTDSLGNTSYLKYDDQYLIVADQNPLGGSTFYEYDQNGRTTAVIDPDGLRTEYSYDQHGNLLKLTRPDGVSQRIEYDHANNPVRFLAPNGGVWQQEWNEQKLLTKQISPLGAESHYQYNQVGDLIALIDPQGSRTELTFDNYSNLTSLTDALGQQTQFSYDVLGNLLSKTDDLGQQTRYQYDLKGRLRKAFFPGGTEIACSYDGEDNLLTYRDEKGQVTKLEYCGLNEVRRRFTPDGKNICYEYDQEERLTKVINQNKQEYRIKYDPLGRIIKEIDYWGQAQRYQYSPGGKLTTSINPLGEKIKYETNPLGQVVAKVLVGKEQGKEEAAPKGPTSGKPPEAAKNEAEEAPAPPRETFAYDPMGNLVASENENIRLEREYDLEGRLVRESQGAEFTIKYEYDLRGNLAKRETTRYLGETEKSQGVTTLMML